MWEAFFVNTKDDCVLESLTWLVVRKEILLGHGYCFIPLMSALGTEMLTLRSFDHYTGFQVFLTRNRKSYTVD